MINRTLLILLLTVATAFSATAAPVTGKAKIASLPLEDQITLATTPEQNMRHTRRLAFKKRFAQARKDKIKILMLGDSITHQWERPSAAPAAKKYLEPYGVLNLGCGGDRTENTIWIVEKSGILELVKPKLVTLMIGTNNRVQPEATAAGIKRILESVRKLYPDTPILLYAIFPRGTNNKNALRIVNDKVNDEIVKFCNGKNIIWVDIRKNFLTPEGILEPEMMPDLLHPRYYKGYSIWEKSLMPYFEKYGK
jgi:lysophospholipase L1-like esterase